MKANVAMNLDRLAMRYPGLVLSSYIYQCHVVEGKILSESHSGSLSFNDGTSIIASRSTVFRMYRELIEKAELKYPSAKIIKLVA